MTTQIIKQDDSKSDIHLTPYQWILVQVLAQIFCYIQSKFYEVRPDVSYVLDALEPYILEGDDSDASNLGQGVPSEDAKSICKTLCKVLDDDKLSGERLETVKGFLEYCEDYASRCLKDEQKKAKGDSTAKEVLFDQNGIISLGSIGSEQDLVPEGGIYINPPPETGCCQCCGRHISELKPFGKAGDPLIGDFEGASLVKKWRPMGPYDEEAEEAMNEAQKCYQKDGYEDALEWMIDKFGKENGEKLHLIAECYACTGSSWECRDCICLDNDEYFEEMRRSWDEQPQALSES